MFKPGDEVICVDDRPYNGITLFSTEDFVPWIVKGQKYTIREYTVFYAKPGVLLAEVRGPCWSGSEILLAAHRFQKIEKKTSKTDISVFEKFKNPKVRELTTV